MEITELAADDPREAERMLALRRAVHVADTPDLPGPCSVLVPAQLRTLPPAAHVERRVVRKGDEFIGELCVEMPTTDNLHFAEIDISVHPSHRRRGIGQDLLNEATAIASQNSRSTISGMTRAELPDGQGVRRDSAGQAFADSAGFDPAYRELETRADVNAVNPLKEDALYAEALAASQDYETIAWHDRVPENLLAGLASINSTFLGEAPIGDLDLEPEKIDANLVRRRDDYQAALGIFRSGVAARHRASGEIVANTVIGVPIEPGDHASQWITIVSPQHRGHKLGLRVKIENLRQIRSTRPTVRWIWTGNAHDNKHMIAINEQLGFQPAHLAIEYQRKW